MNERREGDYGWDEGKCSLLLPRAVVIFRY